MINIQSYTRILSYKKYNKVISDSDWISRPHLGFCLRGRGIGVDIVDTSWSDKDSKNQ